MFINDAHIWIGLFDSQKRLDKYMEEEYGDGNDDEPISEFAKDQKASFYDHDLVYAEFSKKKVAPQELITCWGFPKKAVEKVAAAIEKLGLPAANVSFIADKAEFKKGRSAKGKGYQLWYVGQFKGCSK
jgi:hypothetical protein